MTQDYSVKQKGCSSIANREIKLHNINMVDYNQRHLPTIVQDKFAQIAGYIVLYELTAYNTL